MLRSGITRLCGELQAPIRDPLGRFVFDADGRVLVDGAFVARRQSSLRFYQLPGCVEILPRLCVQRQDVPIRFCHQAARQVGERVAPILFPDGSEP